MSSGDFDLLSKISDRDDFAKYKHDQFNKGRDFSDILRTYTSKCHSCDLCFGAKNIKLDYRGASNPKILIVGDAPGATENERGVSFVGTTSDLLVRSLGEAGIASAEVAFTNLVRCIPWAQDHKSNRQPTESEINACIGYLYEEIKLLDPKVIVTLGNTAYTALTKDASPLIIVRGNKREITVDGRAYPLIPTYHPSYIFRGGAKVADLIADLRIVANMFDQRTKDYAFFNTVEELESYVDLVIEEHKQNKLYAGFISCDLEWKGAKDDSFNAFKKECIISSIQLCHAPYFGRVILWDHEQSNFKDELSKSRIRAALQRLFDTVPVGNHNIKADYKMMKYRVGVEMRHVVFCTMLSHHYLVVDSEPNDIEYVAGKYAGMPKWDHQSAGWKSKMDQCPLDILLDYGCCDVDAVIRVAPLIKKELIDKGMYDSYMRLSNRAIVPVADLESNGLPVDYQKHRELVEKYEKKFNEFLAQMQEYAEVKQTSELYGKFMPNYYQWLHILYFDVLKLPGFEWNKSKTLYSTDVDTREKLLEYCKSKGVLGKEMVIDKKALDRVVDFDRAFEIVNLTHEYKKMHGLLTKFLYPLSLYFSDDGSVHPGYKIAAARTARTLSEDPSAHTLPPRTDIKDMFVSRWATSGGVILKGDESQLELRILAVLSKDPGLNEAFNAGKDVHRYVASRVFKCKEAEVTKDQRRLSKAISFGIVFQGGPGLIALTTGLTFDEAKKLIDDFFTMFPAVQAFMHGCIETARETGIVKIPMGRFRPIDNMNSPDNAKRTYAERQCGNTPIQGGAALLVLDCALNLYEDVKKSNLKSRWIEYTHDSSGYDVYPGELFPIMKKIKFHMQENVSLTNPWVTVPILTDFELGADCGFMPGIDKFHIENDYNGILEIKGFPEKVHKLLGELDVVYNLDYKFSEKDKEGNIKGEVKMEMREEWIS